MTDDIKAAEEVRELRYDAGPSSGARYIVVHRYGLGTQAKELAQVVRGRALAMDVAKALSGFDDTVRVRVYRLPEDDE